ncbi:hypothetical protein [Synechococcus sp. PCC 7336]|uniref:hypothetical protein n=1 Tax=Synechococcus sp. PCC 7336 TaxID=195250 RepID=UPI000347D315|nr:hypothetical protein [Synechococcus sp. PCC 7336]
MQTYYASQADRTTFEFETHRLYLCECLRIQTAAAGRDAATLLILAKESQALSCDIPELLDWTPGMDPVSRASREMSHLNRRLALAH